MKRVIVTGIGVLSSLGNNCREVLESLKDLKSGVSFDENYCEVGLRSYLAGNIKIDTKEHIDRKILCFMGGVAAYAYITIKEAITHISLTEEQVSNIRTGIVTGSGGVSSFSQIEAVDTLHTSGVKRIGPCGVVKCMASTISAYLATPFKIKDVNYSISSAYFTSAHYTGHAAEPTQLGKRDIVSTGDGGGTSWQMGSLFNAMGALSSEYNDTPEQVSRIFDADRDGFMISGSGSILVMEEYEHAKARDTSILCELTGYGTTSSGYDMVQPSGESVIRRIQMALAQHDGKVDYINAHDTSTSVGDTKELGAIREVFAEQEIPFISSTKSLFGHAQGATGSNEAIYSILVMQNDLACASADIRNLDEQAEDLSVLCENHEMKFNMVMSSSFSLSGTNTTLISSRVDQLV